MYPLTISELQQSAKEIRRKSIEMIYKAGSGHPGGSLSSADILTALFLGGILTIDPKNPKNEKRDRFILSCGHVCPSFYAVSAKAKYFDGYWLDTLRNLGSTLQGHPSSISAEFIETSTGSLGQGLSVGIGKALAMRMKNIKAKVVVLSSDGEQNEGSHWESVMSAAFYELGRLCLIIDQNGMQIGGSTKEVLDTHPLLEKYKAFGWDAYEADGHEYSDFMSVFSRFNEEKDKPKVVICRTIRGKGVSFMENSPRYHACTLSEDEYKRAMEELC